MQIVSNGDNFHEISKPIFWEKKKIKKKKKNENVVCWNFHPACKALNLFFFVFCFIFHAYIACSKSSESEEENEVEDTKQEQEVKAKKNVNEFVDDGDDRYILHVAIYTRYNFYIYCWS